MSGRKKIRQFAPDTTLKNVCESALNLSIRYEIGVNFGTPNRSPSTALNFKAA
jgi:hypothetical protein